MYITKFEFVSCKAVGWFVNNCIEASAGTYQVAVLSHYHKDWY